MSPASIIVAALLAGLAFGGAGAWKVQGWRNAAKLAEMQQAVDGQAARNRDLQRAAELRYTVVAETRDRFIVTTVREIRHDTENLAACRLTAAAVQRMRELAACAREDRPASCGAGEQMPSPR